MKDSQEVRIVEWLESGRPLTPMVALKRFGCFRLAARISFLRQHGVEIESRKIKVGDAWVSEYRMEVS